MKIIFISLLFISCNLMASEIDINFVNQVLVYSFDMNEENRDEERQVYDNKVEENKNIGVDDNIVPDIIEKYEFKKNVWNDRNDFLEWMTKYSTRGYFRFIAWRDVENCLNNNFDYGIEVKQCFVYELSKKVNFFKLTGKSEINTICGDYAFEIFEKKSFGMYIERRVRTLKTMIESNNFYSGVRPVALSKSVLQEIRAIVQSGKLIDEKDREREDLYELVNYEKKINKPDMFEKIKIRSELSNIMQKWTENGGSCG
ncbi:hypothetical protein [Marinomonas mediterranea]|uniref:hypothetical protein n=1 Tax=Marinomonas mediterranea TaxID=119864 RepID=UPI00234974AA|nr:hypothetical protein [Marinomonas mediterranea]WCN11268.1 hypothetical protein GV055_21205 [Marinomonas mediterranea]